ncbi:MAG: hypothetical protein NT074_08920 [Methanomicrobiales archaeon]|jgi:hypothetical protein|nr:hypothetical protein [Methanomicrobiales archaeon]
MDRKFICGIILIPALLFAGCTQQIPLAAPQVTEAPTTLPSPVPTTPTPVPTLIPTPVENYVDLLNKANIELTAAKAEIAVGRKTFMEAVNLRGSGPTSFGILQNTTSHFTKAKGHFESAQSLYARAMPLVPSGMKDPLEVTLSIMPDMIKTSDGYLACVQLCQKGDYYGANDMFNSISKHYDAILVTLDTNMVLVDVGS